MRKSKLMRSLGVACLAVGLLACSANADLVNLVENGSFETTVPALTGNNETAVSSGSVTGWETVGASANVLRVTGLEDNFPATGDNVLYARSNGFVRQWIGDVLPNTTYTLTVDMGAWLHWSGGLAHQGYVSISEYDSGGTAVDGAYMGVVSDPLNPHYIPDPGAGNATQVTVVYTTGSTVTPGNQIAVLLGMSADVPVGYGAMWDNVVLTAVPEPATMCLLGLGGLAGLLRRKR